MLIQIYSICLISFFNLWELFPASTCTYNMGSLVNSLFRVKSFNPFPSFTFSSSSSGGMSDKSTDPSLSPFLEVASVNSSFSNKTS